MQVRDKIYIDGAWVPSTGTGTIDVTNSTTEEVMGRIPDGTPQDVDRAVKAARAAFPGWAATSKEERGKYLQRITEGLSARMEDIATVVAGEVGMPQNLSRMIQAGLPAMTFGSMAQIVDGFPFEEQVGNSAIVREPVGVVGAITPWNYPLHQIMAKVAPAIAAGCTVVLKPSEVAPLNAFILAEGCMEIDLPAGVLNIVTGYGPVVGEAIAAHPDVDMVSLTGSVRSGKRVGQHQGYFVEPTIFADVGSKMTIAQEEIFGPVLSILPYDNDDDALRIANDTQYGLAGGVFSGDKERAVRFARKMRTGQID